MNADLICVHLRKSAANLPAFGALFSGGGKRRESSDLLLESLAGNGACVDDPTISRTLHQRAVGVSRRFVRGC